MLGGDAPSPLDLRFPLGPIPVRVSFMFWLIMALLGFGITRVFPGNEWVNLLIWVGCGFVSILIHELGHALAFRAFGSWSAITLHGFGGVAVAPHPPRSAGARLLVALAGPVFGFILCGLAFGGLYLVEVRNVGVHEYGKNALRFLFIMNLFWNILNLLPILPLDGGRVFRELVAMGGGRNPDVVAYGVSFGLALLLAVYGGLRIGNLVPQEVDDALPEWFVTWVRPGMFMTIWFALLAYSNYQGMQMARRQYTYYSSPADDYDDDTPPWRRR